MYKKVFVFKTFLKKELIVSIFSTELSTVCFLPFQFSYFCIPTVQTLSIFKNVIHTKEKHVVHRQALQHNVKCIQWRNGAATSWKGDEERGRLGGGESIFLLRVILTSQ